MDNSKLIDGKLAAHQECPFRDQCEIARDNACRHLGVFHKVPYSCASARAFDLIQSYKADKATTKLLGEAVKQSNENILNQGYLAQMAGKNMVRDNPYDQATNDYWIWRSGYVQAFKDSN